MIKSQLLQDVAGYVDGKIAKAVLNGSYEITEFTENGVTDSTVALNYIVPAAEISLITLIQLKDANDNVLTEDDVHVPITSDHLMLQTIEVKEVTS